MLGVRKTSIPSLTESPIDILKRYSLDFRRSKRLRAKGEISVKEAIGDLETTGKRLRKNSDSGLKGFFEIDYSAPLGRPSRYLALIRKNAHGSPNSLRLARHASSTVTQFLAIQAACIPGLQLSEKDRKRLSIKKHALTVLDPDGPGATVTTLPEDILHYSEPRILTVRENARLQSFPDWFRFQGKYTSGGKARRLDCPRYSQVGNAVPPLFAEAVGNVLKKLLRGRRGEDTSL